MSSSTSTQVPFADATDSDPAVPGDPFVRLRYHYGQLLGAEDFTLEQHGHVLRRRLHQALLHGLGTAWGLRVASRDEEGEARALTVDQGLAVDVLGRDVYVDRLQCLDVTGLAATETWALLQPVLDDAGEATAARRAYVVLRYQACLSQPVPAVTPPCGDASDAVAYGRVNDSFRIDLEAEAPADPHALLREWISAAGPAGGSDMLSPRDRLLAFLLDAGEQLAPLWSSEDDAGLLLAEVQLEQADTDDQRVLVTAVDNTPRALLPSVQLVAESLLGQRLSGADEHAPMRVIAWAAETPDAGYDAQVRVTLTGPVHPGTELGGVRLARLTAAGWSDQDIEVERDGAELVVRVAEQDPPAPWDPGTVFQILLVGEGAMPLLDGELRPLAGWLDEHQPRPGRGENASIIGTWSGEEE